MGTLASGSWLTRERVQRIGVLTSLLSIGSLVLLFALSTGTLDYAGRPLGTDFSNVWTAGRMALDGRAADVWNWDIHFAVQREFHAKPDVDTFGWHYPPPFLLLAAALATLPYLVALVLWQLATLLPLLAIMYRLVPRRETLLLVFAAPVTLICLTHGHNGFLTALLLGGGLMLLDRKPFVAGLLFGCLIYKPHFGLILPPLLLAMRSWRSIAGACTSAALLVAITLAVWGWPVWQAFIESLPLTKAVIIEQGLAGWHKIMSAFSAVRSWGGSVGLAYAVQLLLVLACVAAVVWAALRTDRPDLRNAIVCAAVLISTPYVLDYDYVVLLPALAFLWRDGRQHEFLPWDGSAMAFIWFAPLWARQFANFTLIPMGLLSAIAVAVIALRRLRASPSRH